LARGSGKRHLALSKLWLWLVSFGWLRLALLTQRAIAAICALTITYPIRPNVLTIGWWLIAWRGLRLLLLAKGTKSVVSALSVAYPIAPAVLAHLWLASNKDTANTQQYQKN